MISLKEIRPIGIYAKHMNSCVNELWLYKQCLSNIQINNSNRIWLDLEELIFFLSFIEPTQLFGF